MANKLSIEQIELLQELTDQEGWKIFVKAYLPVIMEEQANKILSVAGDGEDSDKRVLNEQLRYQGMVRMQKNLASLKDFLRLGKTRESGVK
jgi:uncharacterized LabA/DUF88 family protein